MTNIIIEQVKLKKPKVEIAEHKGEGHPDTLCDTLCEKASNALSRYYTHHFGKVLHHNIDKGVIVAGKSLPKFGAGRIKEPAKIIIVGRATSKAGNVRVPVRKIIKKTIDAHMKRFPFFKYKIETDIREGAANLREIFKRPVQTSNDTSFGISHYPLSRLEQTVKEIGHYLNSAAFRNRFPFIGKDIKVMGMRQGNKVRAVVAAAFISRHIQNMNHYKTIKEKVTKHISQKFKIKTELNTLDSYHAEDTIYLTVSGLSCEQGDDGQVGRSNRYNGIISSCMPMSLEAIAGKNIYHPGKIYQILSYIIARKIVQNTGATKATVKLLSKIGSPLNAPCVVHTEICGKINLSRIQNIINQTLKNIPALQNSIIYNS